MAKQYTVNNAGNIDDVRNSIQCGWSRITIEELTAALDDERKNRNRSSFVKLLEASIKRKQKEQLKGEPAIRQYDEVQIPAEYNGCDRDITATVIMIIGDTAHLSIRENMRCSDCNCRSAHTAIKLSKLKRKGVSNG